MTPSPDPNPPSSPAPAARLLDRPLPPAAGVLCAALAVALTTALIYPLREVTPPVSTGVVYLIPVLVISTLWGLWLGLATAVASALAFNFFHIQPTGRFTISDPEHLVALAVFLIAAGIASTVAELARSRAMEAERRRREADISAEMSRALLGGAGLKETLPRASRRLAELLGTGSAQIVLGGGEDDEMEAVRLPVAGGRSAVVVLPADVDQRTLEWVHDRIAPSLAAAIDAALVRDELQERAVEARALRRSDVVKTALLRSVSHDLRSPLTAIIAAAEALGSPALRPGERAELSEGVASEGQRLAGLVDKLLDLSRIEAGAAPQLDWSSVEEVLTGAAQAAGGGGAVELNLDPDTPLVRADPAQLERAFANLIENGVRHSGGQPVTVTARRDRDTVIVRVVDRGPGIAPADLGRIFDPFVRLDASDSHPGSGLGLAIAKGFVEAGGGEIRAESLPGQGSAFVVELPIGGPE